jgi:hypothetical protein
MSTTGLGPTPVSGSQGWNIDDLLGRASTRMRG